VPSACWHPPRTGARPRVLADGPLTAPRLSLRERGKALADRRVLGILAGTVTVLIPVFLVIAYLPAIRRTSGAWIVARCSPVY
jgi:hypothetical protein